MRILFLTTPRECFSPVSGGAVATVVEAVARRCAALGHDVVVASRCDKAAIYDTVPVVSLGAVPWPRTPVERARWAVGAAQNRLRGWHWPAYRHYLRSLRSAVAAMEPPDLVVNHNDPFTTPYVRRWLPGVPVALWVHNELGARSLAALDRAPPDAVIAVSAYIRDRLVATSHTAPEAVTVIHNGIDLEVFHPRPDFDQPSRPVRVLAIGRLDPTKGTDIVARAVARLRASGHDMALTVVGSPWFRETPGAGVSPWVAQLLAEVAAAGGTHRPHVPRDTVPAIIRTHDVGCVLSRWNDPFPLTVLELMASGCAVVGSPRGGIPEAAGGAATLVDPDDIEAVTAALGALADDPARLVQEKRRAVERAAAADWGGPVAAFLHLADSLVGR